MSESTKKHKATSPKVLNFGIFVCSTSRYQILQKGERTDDVSGDLIVALLENAGHRVLFKRIIADDKILIQDSVKSSLCDSDLDAVIFCGGTGIAPSDVTIEMVSPFLEKVLPGFGEIFRHLSYDKVGSGAVLSRAIAGVARGKAFFCIPGSPDASRLAVEMLILTETPHIVRHARE